MEAWSLTRLLFWIVASGILISATSVVTTKKPVIGVLSLIACFVLGSILWLFLGAEFLSMGLIFVYVGAVMTLFLFVVMMLNQNEVDELKNRNKILALGFLLFVFLAYGLLRVSVPEKVMLVLKANEPNVNILGKVLYTKYLLSFEITAVILLVAMLAAITLVFRGQKQQNKHQNVREQVNVEASDRVELKDLRGGNATK